MKVRRKKFEESSPIDSLLLREKLGIKRYKKQVKRDTDEREILLDLAIKKMEEKEKDDFIPIGNKRRKIKIP
jgi:hypothetical protein